MQNQPLNAWTPEIAANIAQLNNIELTAQHWEVIHTLREIYNAHLVSPGMRILIKELQRKYGAEKDSIYLHTLFPGDTVTTLYSIAGLPKPIRCI